MRRIPRSFHEGVAQSFNGEVPYDPGLEDDAPPIAVEERMGEGMSDSRAHHAHSSSLKDNRPSMMDPRQIPDDETTQMIERGLPKAQKQKLVSGMIVGAEMTEGGASVTIANEDRVVCVFCKGMTVIEINIPVSAYLNKYQENSWVTLERGAGDEVPKA